MRYAIVFPDTLVVDNIVIWGGEGDMFSGFVTVPLEEGEPCAPGWSYNPVGTPRFEDPAQNTQDVE